MSNATGVASLEWEPPYYAVIFTSKLSPDHAGYAEMAERMVEAVKAQPGFLGFESARGADGVGITVSYWRDVEAIKLWKQHGEHQEAQAIGKTRWYECYALRVARVERAYGKT